MQKARLLFSAAVFVVLIIGTVSAQTTAFTYQGSLKDGASIANGNYDFEFALFDAISGGTQLGATLSRNTVAVANGIFSVSLDFGSQFPGANRFLEISVRLTGGGGLTTLAPRQPVNSAPYSVKSLNSAAADTATNATQLGGVAANQYVVTTDPRMTDARAPTAGSPNYVQNQNGSAQTSSNFNITGNGTLGGSLNAGNIITSSASITNTAPEVGISINNQNSNANIWALNSSGGNSSLGTHNFSISNLLGGVPQPKFVINATAGNVGIGTIAPSAQLEVVGGPTWTSAGWTGSLKLANSAAMGWAGDGAGMRFGIGQTNGGLLFFRTTSDIGNTGAAANYVLTLTDAGNVGIGTTTPDQALSVNGNASKASGGTTWAVFSDERLKNLHGNFTRGLSALMQLQPIRYQYKADNALGLRADSESVGFSAQQVQRVLPEAVTTSTSGYLQLNSDPILWTMLNSIKEQQGQIEQQKKEIEQLKSHAAEMDSLKKLVCLTNKQAEICKE